MALVAHFDLELHQIDVKTAFLNGDLHEDVYMAQPRGFKSKGQEHLVCKLKKSIYGLKQASRQWYLKFDKVMKKHNFIKNQKAAKKVLRYLQGTKEYKLTYTISDNLEVIIHSDSDFAKCKDTSRSTSGYIFKLSGGPISWKSHKQVLTTTCHAMLLRNLITRLKIINSISRPLKIYCDNNAVVSFLNNNSSTGAVLYLYTKYLFVRERVKKQRISIEHIRTHEMLADPLTKGLPPKVFQSHVAKMGFRQDLNNVVAGLISSRASILVNGSPTSEFSLKRGLRQGDPLSPFLFIIVMEGLNIMLKDGLAANLFHGIKIGSSSLHLSHLFYADDVIIFSEWNQSDMDNIIRILDVFFLASRLKININKSNLYGVGVSSAEVANMAEGTGCSSSSLPFSYLGLPIGSNMGRITNWTTLIDRFKARLSGWKANMLSSGGRLTLIKSVLGSLSIYYFSIFKAPEAVIKQLESLRASFFWGASGDKKNLA
ncbi:putative RNA-directed DNA polymerase, eukaryota, reverse transcriptase zinc-binding domain protein [Tanacetum coccineum]